MPNQRAAGQQLITLYMKETFLRALDRAFPAAGYSARSEFIRDAILEKLQSMGILLPASEAAAPSRAGKGGRPHKRKHQKAAEPIDEVAKAFESNEPWFAGASQISSSSSAGKPAVSGNRQMPRRRGNTGKRRGSVAASAPGAIAGLT